MKVDSYRLRNNLILPVIVIAQFCGTSLWFAGNGIMNDLVKNFQLGPGAVGHLTSAVQLGFITGTLLFAFLTIADRYSPSRVFLISALTGGLFNLGLMLESNELFNLLIFRYFTGFFLAGIYPVGMKIASDYYKKGLGKSLGFLVGALVVGTAFPHLLKGFSTDIPWKFVVIVTSALAIIGGLLIFILIPDGPYRKQGKKLDLTILYQVFKNRSFRSAAFGYFGHMWELYAFWAFVPVILWNYQNIHTEIDFSIPLLSFFIIGLGGLACVMGGYISIKVGVKKTAVVALLLSGLCCLLSPMILSLHSHLLVIAFLLFWGLVVIADSPLFSTLVANNASAENRGTALTIVNSIGFAITIISIQLINYLSFFVDVQFVLIFLAFGPASGLVFLIDRKK